MKKILAFLFAAAIGSAPAFAADVSVRELDRAWITHCTATTDAPPVVVVTSPVTFDGFAVEPGVTVEGDVSVDLGCRMIDSKVDGWGAEGRLMVYSDEDTYQIEEMIYSANVWSGRTAYGVADWATTRNWSANGAQYTMESGLQFDDTGLPLVYDVSFLRRAAAESDDPATIMRVTRESEDGVLIFDLVFKEAKN